jgi:hypothetical protein
MSLMSMVENRRKERETLESAAAWVDPRIIDRPYYKLTTEELNDRINRVPGHSEEHRMLINELFARNRA